MRSTVIGHRNRAPVDDLVSRGAKEAKDLRALAEASDIVVICVTGSPEVEAVVAGPDGLAAAGKKLMIVDCSTSDPSSTTRLAAQMKERGITLIDAPLSRTPKDAEEGTLDVMVGGDDADVARARPVIDCFAGRVVHTGPTGSGHTMKLLNNFVSLGYAAIYSEALALGAKAGLTPQVFDQVIRGGRMECPFYQTFFQYVVGRDPNAHRFAIRNALKDLTYLAGLRQRLGHRQSDQRRGAQFLRARRQCRPGRTLRADAVRLHRRAEWRLAGVMIIRQRGCIPCG